MNPRRWAIQVAGNYSWFESFVDRHDPIDVGFMVGTYDAQPNQYAIVSHHLDDLSDPVDVADRGASLISLLDGALYLQIDSYAGLHTSDLVELETGRRFGFGTGTCLLSRFPRRGCRRASRAASATFVSRRSG